MTDEPTSTAPPGARAQSTPDLVSAGRFVPGTVLASRYRVVALLGQGGMGERLARFRAEVRTDSARRSAAGRSFRAVRWAIEFSGHLVTGTTATDL